MQKDKQQWFESYPSDCHLPLFRKGKQGRKNNKASLEYKSKRCPSTGLHAAWEMNREQERKRMATFPLSNSSHQLEDCWVDDNHAF